MWNGDEFGLTSIAAVRVLGKRSAVVRVHLGPAPIQKVLYLAPAARRQVHEEWYSKIFGRVLSTVPATNMVFSKKYPRRRTFTCTIAGEDLTAVRRIPGVMMVSILSIAGRQRRKLKQVNVLWYAVQARFAIQIEGRTRGMQSYEDRIVVVKAFSFEDAERRLRRKFRDYATPHLNPYYEMVRWNFERVLDVYQMNDTEFDPRGAEVFSTLRERRMRPEFEWHPRKEMRGE